MNLLYAVAGDIFAELECFGIVIAVFVGRIIPVSFDNRIGIESFQVYQERYQCIFLRLCSCVFGWKLIIWHSWLVL